MYQSYTEKLQSLSPRLVDKQVACVICESFFLTAATYLFEHQVMEAFSFGNPRRIENILLYLSTASLVALSLENPFHIELGSSDPLGGQKGCSASLIQIQKVKSQDKIMYISAQWNTSDSPG